MDLDDIGHSTNIIKFLSNTYFKHQIQIKLV